jgi:hypothetical protein
MTALRAVDGGLVALFPFILWKRASEMYIRELTIWFDVAVCGVKQRPFLLLH